MKHSFGHITGGAFLVAGTSIGAGMLALPVVSSIGGFWPSLIIYLAVWMIMTATGLLYLELSLKMPTDANIISMAQHYLGKKGKLFSWIIYLFLFYCLSVSYISGGGDLIKSVTGDLFSIGTCNLLFMIIFGFFVYRGALVVDRINLILMMGLGISYFAFVFLGAGNINFSYLQNANWKPAILALPVILVSFGYQGIVPTLTYYMKKDARKIRLSIILGTTMALFVYLIWEMLILGIIPIDGELGLAAARIKGETAIEPLRHYANIKTIYAIGKFFSFFAITTSFLGVSLGLFDFLADGLKIQKKGLKKIGIAAATFLPPTIITLINPKLFLVALGYAGGIGGVLLLVFLPTLMVWHARYIQKDIKIKRQLFGGKAALIVLFIFVAFELIVEIVQEFFNFVS